MLHNRPINRKSRDPVVSAFIYYIIIQYIVWTDWTAYKKIDPTIYDRVCPFPI